MGLSITLFGFLSTTFWGMVLARGLNGALSGNGSVSKAALGEMTDRTNEGQSVGSHSRVLGRVRSRPPRVEVLIQSTLPSSLPGLAFPLFSLQWSLGLALGCVPDRLCPCASDQPSSQADSSPIIVRMAALSLAASSLIPTNASRPSSTTQSSSAAIPTFCPAWLQASSRSPRPS